MIDNHWSEITHAERVALHLRLVQELRGDDNCRGAAGGFSLMPSCVQHDVHDPQSPIAVKTMSLFAAIASMSAGSASLEKLSLR